MLELHLYLYAFLLPYTSVIGEEHSYIHEYQQYISYIPLEAHTQPVFLDW